MNALWAYAARPSDCPTCSVRLLPMFTEQADPGAESWCPVCSAAFRAPPKQKDPASGERVVRAPPARGAAEPRALHPRSTSSWCFRVEADGTITLSVGGYPRVPIPLEAVASFSKAMIWLGLGAQSRLDGIRGADRWTFLRHGEVYEAHFLNEQRVLRPYMVRRTKYRPAACYVCAAELLEGVKAYQPCGPHPTGGRTPWADVRLCRGCVEAAEDAPSARPALRVIHGERGGRREAR